MVQSRNGLLKGKHYLVIIDYHSNDPDLALLSSILSNCVITHAKSVFARHGIPHTVMSDNGPCFNRKEWQDFAETYDFKHVKSSPQSNGKAEKGVHILTQLLKKASDSNSDPYLALLSYRASPLECRLSPAELLMKRKLRTKLPSCSKLKKHPKLEQRLKLQKLKQKTFYDRTAKQLPSLSRDDPVRIESPGGWITKATFLQEVAPQSYTLSNAQTESESISPSSENCNTDMYTETQTKTHTLDEMVKRRSARTIKNPERLNL
uniref:Integrase catalytic domain-containing protein n=1 Tax=Pygocentrus nattereri TaxID=42514 RepID=A0A3B4CX82_PYGNA